MANENLIYSLSNIERALGIIEGVSCGLENKYADALIGAIEMIDCELKNISKEIEDGK